MKLEKNQFDGTTVCRTNLDSNGNNQYIWYRSYFSCYFDSNKFTQNELNIINDFIEDKDCECGHRWQMPLKQLNTLLWIGNRWVRVVICNGAIKIVERFEKTSFDENAESVFCKNPIY